MDWIVYSVESLHPFPADRFHVNRRWIRGPGGVRKLPRAKCCVTMVTQTEVIILRNLTGLNIRRGLMLLVRRCPSCSKIDGHVLSNSSHDIATQL